MSEAQQPIQNRCEAVFLFDVADGNPNGDPDAGNLPRTDPETGQGIVTDVCLKRKVRNLVGMAKGEEPPYDIYIKERAVLNRTHDRAYEATGVKAKGSGGKKKANSVEAERELTAWLCRNFYDIRTFGAVMTTDINAGQVQGPVQLSFARSIDPVTPTTHSITRCAVTNERDLEKERTMGDKHTVPYGLYRAHVFVSPFMAQRTGFSQDDLELFWDALCTMFDHDHSAARGQMSARALYIFEHDSALGRAPASALLDRVRIARSPGADVPRCIDDYAITVEEAGLPDGVSLTRRLDLPATSLRAVG